MDFRYLKAFVLTAQYGSFSKAAYHLKIAQSAVSRQIKLLEESLGEELIIRSSKKVVLTEKGENLFQVSKQFIAATDELFQTESQKTIKIGVLHGLLENWLSNVLVKYYQTHENNIEIHIDSPMALKRDMEEGRYDLIFSVEDIQSELITSLALFEERLVLISKKKVNASKLHEYRWIVYNENDYLFQISKKISPHVLQVGSSTAMVTLVKSAVGIAIIPDHLVRSSDGLEQVPMSAPKRSRVYMSSLNYKSLPNYLKQFIDVVKDNLPHSK